MKVKKKNQEAFREQLSKLFEVPPEVMSDFPKIALTGNKEISIENFNNLIEYTTQKIRMSTKCGILIIDGIELEVNKMTADYIIIKGTIIQVGFVL